MLRMQNCLSNMGLTIKGPISQSCSGSFRRCNAEMQILLLKSTLKLSPDVNVLAGVSGSAFV